VDESREVVQFPDGRHQKYQTNSHTQHEHNRLAIVVGDTSENGRSDLADHSRRDRSMID
jgi:hypothetical protein